MNGTAQVLDSNGYYRGYVPRSLGATVLHIFFIQSWNKVYRSVATSLTNWENHRTEEVMKQGATRTRAADFCSFHIYIENGSLEMK